MYLLMFLVLFFNVFIVGEPEEPEIAHEPGMIDVLKQGFAEIKEKIGNNIILK